MSDVSWWQKKLGTAPRPQSTPGTWNLPQVRQPTPNYQAPPEDLPVQQWDGGDPAPPGQIHALDAVVRFKGSKTAQREQTLCPNCSMGGRKVYLFSRAQGQNESGAMVRLTKINSAGQACAPASVCFECGYNGLFEPFGGTLNDQIG